MRSFVCLYTKQKEKKKKSWSDGFLKLDPNGLCKLYSNDVKNVTSNYLETKFLLPQQSRIIERGDELTIDFESYVVLVESRIQSTKIQTLNPILTKSFKIPQSIPQSERVKPNTDVENTQFNRSLQSHTSASAGRAYRYQVDDNELDAIWDHGEGHDDDDLDVDIQNEAPSRNQQSSHRHDVPYQHNSSYTTSSARTQPYVHTNRNILPLPMQNDDDIWGDIPTGPDLTAPNREGKRQRTAVSSNAYDNSIVENTNNTATKTAAEKDNLWDF